MLLTEVYFIFTLIGDGTFWLVIQRSSTWGTEVISWGILYLIFTAICFNNFSGLILAVGNWYKNRKREDVLPNEHIFCLEVLFTNALSSNILVQLLTHILTEVVTQRSFYPYKQILVCMMHIIARTNSIYIRCLVATFFLWLLGNYDAFMMKPMRYFKKNSKYL